MSQKHLMSSTEFPIIIDLRLNPKPAAEDKFYFLRSLQAPLTTGEVACLAAAMLDLEGRRERRRLRGSRRTNSFSFVRL